MREETDPHDLLRQLRESADGGAFAMACDGRDLAAAYNLARRGLAEWKGDRGGSSFWAITQAGRDTLAKEQP